jgi:hypothetical protein
MVTAAISGSPPFRRGERVGLAGQRGQRGGHFGQAGAHVSRGGSGLAAAVGVPGVGARHGIPEIPLTGRERFTNPAEYLSPANER